MGTNMFNSFESKTLNYLDSIYRKIVQKEVIWMFVLFASFVIFKSPIENILTNLVIKNVLGKVTSHWSVDVVFYVVVVAVLLRFTHKVGNYSPSKLFTLILAFITLVYSYYRFFESTWTFTPFISIPELNYTDVLILLLLCEVALYFIPFKLHTLKLEKETEGINKNNTSPLLLDEPLGASGVDELMYSDFANNLSDKILNGTFIKAFAVGINGQWGQGKTSFIDLMKRAIDGKNNKSIIEIDFKPWNSNSPQSIIQDFFEQFHNATRPYHSSLSRLLLQYSEKLVSIKNNTVTQIIHSISFALSDVDSKQDIYDSINDMIGAIKRKFIIYIDDLDRLDKTEIHEVLRLIRNSANFQNTVFIVAYDRSYLVNAIENLNAYEKDKYLNKIFQVEVSLPKYEKLILREKLGKNLDDRFNVIEGDNLSSALKKVIKDSILDSESMAYLHELDVWLHNLRDVTRLTNTFVIYFDLIKYEVDFKDFLKIELLRLKYPAVYSFFEANYADFLELKDNENYYSEGRYGIKIAESEKNGKISSLESELNENSKDLFIGTNDIRRIMSLFEGLFNENKLASHSLSNRSISFTSKLENYFSYRHAMKTIPEEDFLRAIYSNPDNLKNKISQWIEEKLTFDLKRKFHKIRSFESRKDFEKCIDAIFYIANHRVKSDQEKENQRIWYPVEDACSKIWSMALEHNSDSQDLEKFLSVFFVNAQSPFLFEADFLRYLSKNTFEELKIFDRNKIYDWVLGYFEKYAEQIEKIDATIWQLNNIAYEISRHLNPGETTSPNEIRCIWRKFLDEKDADGFLLEMVLKVQNHQTKIPNDLYEVNNFAEAIFDDWTSFKNWLIQYQGVSHYKKEFLSFFEQYQTENYKPINFQFEDIPVREKYIR